MKRLFLQLMKKSLQNFRKNPPSTLPQTCPVWNPGTPLYKGGEGGKVDYNAHTIKGITQNMKWSPYQRKVLSNFLQKCLLNTQRKSVFQWARILTTSLALLDKVQGCHALSIIYWNFLWLSSNHFIHVSLLKSASQDVTLIWQNCSWI